MVVGCWLFLAVGDQFGYFQTLRFAVTFQTVHMPPLTSPCNPNFGPPKVPHFFSMRTTQRTAQPRKFRRFPIFGRFRTERTSRGVKTWPFQYRTPRSRPVIPSPRSFSASPILLTQFSGNFPPSLFNGYYSLINIVSEKRVGIILVVVFFGIQFSQVFLNKIRPKGTQVQDLP